MNLKKTALCWILLELNRSGARSLGCKELNMDNGVSNQ